MSRRHVLVDTSYRETIKRRMYQLYQVKEHDSQEAMTLQSSPQFSLGLVQLLQQPPFYLLCSLVLSLFASVVLNLFVSIVFVVVVVVLYML